MFLRFLRKYWGCPPLIISLVMLFSIYLTHRNTELHLRYVPSLVLVWLSICALTIFALWGLLTIRRWLQRKEIYIETAHITITTVLAIFLCITGWIVTRFCLWPEQTTVKHDIQMVACTQSVLSKNIYYYEYVNPFFYGKYLGSEYYGDIFDLSSNPLKWEFYDLDGNLIEANPSPTDTEHGETFSPQEYEPIDIAFTARAHKEGELVFSVTADEFITAYNSLYYRDRGTGYLAPIKEWTMFPYDFAPHSDYATNYYRFQKNETWIDPTFSIYVPADGDGIQEITLNFDDHGYTDSMYALYEEMCFYTLKVIFPDLDDEEITQLYKTLNSLAYGNIFPNEQGYYNNRDPVPCALYYKDDIGLYPYFAIGEYVHLCIIPVSEEVIEHFEMNGAEIHEVL